MMLKTFFCEEKQNDPRFFTVRNLFIGRDRGLDLESRLLIQAIFEA
jgi:hypothetical protein